MNSSLHRHYWQKKITRRILHYTENFSFVQKFLTKITFKTPTHKHKNMTYTKSANKIFDIEVHIAIYQIFKRATIWPSSTRLVLYGARKLEDHQTWKFKESVLLLEMFMLKFWCPATRTPCLHSYVIPQLKAQMCGCLGFVLRGMLLVSTLLYDTTSCKFVFYKVKSLLDQHFITGLESSLTKASWDRCWGEKLGSC